MKTIFISTIMLISSIFCTKMGFVFADKQIDQFQYSYHDSSVPPPYHRSYTITVDSNTVGIVVNSYGDILTDTSFASSPENLTEIIALLDKGKVKNKKLGDNMGCTGGTGESIMCMSKGVSVFSGNVYHCGGSDSGNLSGNYSLAADAARALIPDIEALMKR